MYIHRLSEWPQFKWEEDQIITLLAEVRNLQGRLLGKMGMLGFELQEEAKKLLDTKGINKLKKLPFPKVYVLDEDEFKKVFDERLS